MINDAVTIEYTGQRLSLKLAVQKVNQILRDNSFFEQIAKHQAFSGANITPAAVVELIHNANVTIDVDVYMATDPQDTTEGYFDIEDPLFIHINMYKTERAIPALCNTIVRLSVAAICVQFPQYDLGADAEKGVSRSIGMIAEHMVGQQILVAELLGKNDMAANLKYIRH